MKMTEQELDAILRRREEEGEAPAAPAPAAPAAALPDARPAPPAQAATFSTKEGVGG